MSTSTSVHSVALSDAVWPTRYEHCALIADLVRWAAGRGLAAPPDVVALHLAAKHGPLQHWTRVGVYDHLRCSVFGWCTRNAVVVPDQVPEALWTYLHHLDEHELLAPGSDPLDALCDPLRCYGGLGDDGLPSVGETEVACRCTVPYVVP